MRRLFVYLLSGRLPELFLCDHALALHAFDTIQSRGDSYKTTDQTVACSNNDSLKEHFSVMDGEIGMYPYLSEITLKGVLSVGIFKTYHKNPLPTHLQLDPNRGNTITCPGCANLLFNRKAKSGLFYLSAGLWIGKLKLGNRMLYSSNTVQG